MPPPPTGAPRPAGTRIFRANVRLTLALLAAWLFFGLGCGVLWADWLNRFQLGGFPLGFWFAQQGSILVFVLLVLIYAVAMAAIERRHGRNGGTGDAPNGSAEQGPR